MTQSTEVATVTEIPSKSVEFTERDRQMILEIHSSIIALTNAVAEMLPALSKSPIGKMLGL